MTSWPAHWAGDAVLADGGTVHVRPIQPSDASPLEAFHARLSAESIYLRYFSPHPRLSAREIEHFTHVDHDARVALVVLLGDALIGVGRYDRIARSDAAEVAFLVDDAHQGRGIATLLVERLAAAARERGLQRFTADVLPHNRSMLHVFHDVGFDVTSRFEDGVVRLSFPIDPNERFTAVAAERDRLAQVRSLGRLLSPEGIGVVAEGPAGEALAAALLRQLGETGFTGTLRRVAASAPGGETAGLDLVYVAVPPDRIAAQIERCGEFGAHAAVLLVSGSPEDEAPAARGDRELAARARRHGLRLVGPASLGVARLSGPVRFAGLVAGALPPAGGVALFAESPQRGHDALDAAAARGIGLSTFVSAGRKADVSVSDVLQFFESDDATRVVALVLRSFGNPRHSAEIARRVTRRKPVLAWLADPAAPVPAAFVRALEEHAGVIPCHSLEDLLDVAAALLAAPGTAPGPGVSDRLASWQRARKAPAGRLERAEGVDPFAARRRVDALLAASPTGVVPPDDDVAMLLRCYGIRAGEPDGTPAHALLRVVQDPAWGSIVALEHSPGDSRARLVPLTDRDVRVLAAPGPHVLRAVRRDLVRRVATLAADLPELAALALSVPAQVGERPAPLRGSARLAPWTLGPAVPRDGR